RLHGAFAVDRRRRDGGSRGGARRYHPHARLARRLRLTAAGSSPITALGEDNAMKLEAFRRRFRQRLVRVGGQNWHVIETGARAKAPVLVMLPGTLGTAEIFWNQIAALRGRARIVSVTYPPVAKILTLAEGLAALLDMLGIAKASVVGSSLGGYLAQWFAARHPDRVETLYIGNSLTDPKLVNPARMQPAALSKAPAEVHQAVVLGSVETWPEPEPVFRRLKE